MREKKIGNKPGGRGYDKIKRWSGAQKSNVFAKCSPEI